MVLFPLSIPSSEFPVALCCLYSTALALFVYWGLGWGLGLGVGLGVGLGLG